jgi:hypothetical protein
MTFNDLIVSLGVVWPTAGHRRFFLRGPGWSDDHGRQSGGPHNSPPQPVIRGQPRVALLGTRGTDLAVAAD